MSKSIHRGVSVYASAYVGVIGEGMHRGLHKSVSGVLGKSLCIWVRV